MRERLNRQFSTSLVDLLHRAGQRVDEEFSRNIGNRDVTPRQVAILSAIAQKEGASQTEIVNVTGMDRSTTADVVLRLVKRGWLQRRRTRSDARAYSVKLTAEGRNALKLGQAAASQAEEQLLVGLPVAQRQQFMTALKTIAAASGSLKVG